MIDISLPDMVRKPIILAGGTCSGKSTLLHLLDTNPIFGHQIRIVPEVFTDLVSRGVIKPTLEPEGLIRNILVTAETQAEVERQAAQAAVVRGQILVTDRGLPDVPVFLPGGIPEAEAMVGHSLAEMLGRYGLVIYLGLPPRKVFEAERAQNPARHRTYEQVCEIERRTLDIYGRHPNFVSVPYVPNWTYKVDAVILEVHAYL